MGSPTLEDLGRAARRHRREREAARAARLELARLIREAIAAGVSVRAIAASTGLEPVEVRAMRDRA